MKNTTQPFELDQPLSKALFETSAARFTSYRAFPVFSKPWVVRRTLWVVFWSLLLSTFIGGALKKANPGSELASGVILANMLHMVVTVCLATITAYFARRRFVNTPLESRRTIQALCGGMLVAVVISFYFGQKMEELYPNDGLVKQTPVTQPQVTQIPVDEHQAAEKNASDNLSNLVINVVFIALFGGGYAGFAYVHERGRMDDLREKQAFDALRAEKLEIESKLTVLQAQVEPHFLFNSLASVRALIKPDPDKAHASIDALVEYLRVTIPKMRTEQERPTFSTIAQQVQIARAYLEVMTHRMGDRLVVVVDLPEALNSTPFPPLLLISLVENAVKHGAEPNGGCTTITISVGTIDDKQLFVRVMDDGAGLVPQATSGIGLANIRAQLAARFGTAASFNLRQANAAATPKGVIAKIIVPIE